MKGRTSRRTPRLTSAINRALGGQSREVHVPIHFPSISIISRERLLPGWSFGVCLIPAKFYQHRNTVVLIVSAKQSDCAGERTFNWRIESCAICIHPINAPKSGTLVEQ